MYFFVRLKLKVCLSKFIPIHTYVNYSLHHQFRNRPIEGFFIKRALRIQFIKLVLNLGHRRETLNLVSDCRKYFMT